MPTNRRRRTRAYHPTHYTALPPLERLSWGSGSMSVAEAGAALSESAAESYVLWPTWDALFGFYEGCREAYLAEYYGHKPHATPPGIERRYQLWLVGDDPEAWHETGHDFWSRVGRWPEEPAPEWLIASFETRGR